MKTKIKIINQLDDDFIIDGEEPDVEKKFKRDHDSFEPTVQYQGRAVNKRHFRVFVYGENSKQLLCNTYEEYLKALESGEWFESIDSLNESLLDKSLQECFGDIADTVIEEPKPEKKKPGPKPKVKIIEEPEIDLPTNEVIEYGADR